MLAFLASLLLSFLPQRYRAWWRHEESEEMCRAALVSGLLQSLACLGFVLGRYLTFIQARVGEMSRQIIEQGGDLPGRAGQMGMGFISLLEFLLQPLTLLLLYFAFEGLVRLSAAVISEEVLPTLPFYLVAWVQGRAERAQAERALGPLVVDRVEPGEGREFDWRIASCRPKPNWDRLMTIAYQDELYEVAKEERWAKPRPYVYFLRKAPENKVVRGLHHYRPDEVLEEK